MLPFRLDTSNLLNRYITWWGLCANGIWGAVILFHPEAMKATPMSTLAQFFNQSQYALSVALLSSVAATFTALAFDNRVDVRSMILLIPQQFLMVMAAGGSVLAVYQGEYADGVQRSHWFILADQLPWILAALFYTFSIVEHFGRRKVWKVSG